MRKSKSEKVDCAVCWSEGGEEFGVMVWCMNLLVARAGFSYLMLRRFYCEEVCSCFLDLSLL